MIHWSQPTLIKLIDSYGHRVAYIRSIEAEFRRTESVGSKWFEAPRESPY